MVPSPGYKIVLLGDSSVGKTSLVHRFINDSFNENTANTIGAAFITKKCPLSNDPNRHVKLEIWDTAGQERYRSLTPMYYRSARVALVCFDMSDIQSSFERVRYWVDQMELNSSETQTIEKKVIVVGNKSDMYKESDSNELAEIEAYCEEHQLQLFHCSAKDGKGVTELFTYIVDKIDDSFFQKAAQEPTVGRQRITLSSVSSSKCC
ncbi:Ras-related protein Rab-5C [Meyerozyma sp. JA9]|nr:Ras-related protein Rab-5C [Meyerozyma sp. JA9]